MTEQTLKQWKRRALVAETELETLRKIRIFEEQHKLQMVREIASTKVVLNECKEAIDWMHSYIEHNIGNASNN